MTTSNVAIVSIIDSDSRDEAEGPLLPEEEAHSDMASFQPTDSDVPSFLEDCNRVTVPFILAIISPLKSPYSIKSLIFIECRTFCIAKKNTFLFLLTGNNSSLFFRPNYLVVSIRFGLI